MAGDPLFLNLHGSRERPPQTRSSPNAYGEPVASALLIVDNVTTAPAGYSDGKRKQYWHATKSAAQAHTRDLNLERAPYGSDLVLTPARRPEVVQATQRLAPHGKATATFKDGVLEVSLPAPRREEKRAKQIQVQ